MARIINISGLLFAKRYRLADIAKAGLRIIIGGLCVTLMCTATILSSSPPNDSPIVTVKVIDPGLNLVREQDLLFREYLQSNKSYTVKINDEMPYGPRAARFSIYCGTNWNSTFSNEKSQTQVLMGFDSTTSLSNGVDIIRFSPSAAYNNSLVNPTDSNGAILLNTVEITTISIMRKSALGGRVVVWIYGNIDIGSVSEGIYTGIYTIDVVYGGGVF